MFLLSYIPRSRLQPRTVRNAYIAQNSKYAIHAGEQKPPGFTTENPQPPRIFATPTLPNQHLAADFAGGFVRRRVIEIYEANSFGFSTNRALGNCH